MNNILTENGIKPIYGFDNGQNIYFIYRNKEDKKKVFTIKDFVWYFCISKKDLEYDEVKKVLVKGQQRTKCITKIKTSGNYVKIYCIGDRKIPYVRFMVKDLEKAGAHLKESDLSITKRYMIDNMIDIEENLKYLFFDIETNDSNLGIEIGRDEILSWAACDNTGKTFFSINKNIKSKKAEAELIKELVNLFVKYDLVISWNGNQFDMPYIMKRIEVLDIRSKKGDLLYESAFWKTFLHIDLMQRLIKLFGPMMTVVGLSGFSLNEVSKVFLGDTKVEHSEKIIELFNDNKEKLEEYNIQDVNLLYHLNEKLRTLPLMIKECAWTGTFMDRFYIGELLDNYILREAALQNFHLRSRPTWEESEMNENIVVRGGYVKDPDVGFYNNVRIFDFKCFSKGTKIYTEKGYKNIEDITLKDKVQDVDNKFSYLETISKQKYKGELYKITTSNGYTAECTPNHKWPIFENNELILKEAKNLTTSDKLLSPVKLNFKEKNTNNILYELLGILYFESSIKKIKHRTKEKYISDDYRVSLSIGKHEVEFKNRISFLLKNLNLFDYEWLEVKNSFVLKIGNRLKNGKRNTKEVYEWFLKQKEKLNETVFLNNSYNISHFCKGAFEADGTVNIARNTVVINSGSKYKINQNNRIEFLHHLLKRLGIYSNLGIHKTTHILEIYRMNDIFNFKQRIGFISKYKKTKLDNAIVQRIKTTKNKTLRLSKYKKIGRTEYVERRITKIEKIKYNNVVYNLGLRNQRHPFYIANDLLSKNSMYPSIIVSWNIGQESLTGGSLSKIASEHFDAWVNNRKIDLIPYEEWYEFLKKENKVLNPDNKYVQSANNQYFKRDKTSVIAGLVKNLLTERKAYKKQQLESKYNSIEYKNAQASQEAVKEMANSIYGITADKQSRYFDPRIAEAITLTGQFLNRTTMAILKKMGYPSIAGDTDSIFTIIDDDAKTLEVIDELNKKLSEHLIKKYKFTDCIVYTEYEKKFRKFIMLDKKRYSGHLVEIDGKKVDSILSKGTENVRKNTIDFTKNKVNECFDLLLKKDKDLKYMKKWLRNLKEYVLTEDIPGDQLSITMKISKPISSYKSKPPHVKLAEKMIADKEILETHEGKHVWGQKIEYIIVDNNDKSADGSVVLLRDFDGKWDRKYYWDVQIYAPLMRILKTVWPEENWEEHNIIFFEKQQKKIEQAEKKEQREKERLEKQKEREAKKKSKQLKLKI